MNGITFFAHQGYTDGKSLATLDGAAFESLESVDL